MKTDLDKATKEIEDILKKYKAKVTFKFDFPMYKQLPAEVELAMKVLRNHDLKVAMLIEEKDK